MVCRAYDCAIDDAELQDGPAAKEKAKADTVKRQKCWINRRDSKNDPSSWRPSKRHRLQAKAAMVGLDNQTRGSLPLRGLVDFVKDDASNMWENWRTWLHLTLNIDQGSDMLCGGTHLRSLMLCITLVCDWSHGGQNDFYDCLKELGLFPFWLLLLIVMNVEHGPFHDDLRFNQQREGWADACKHFDWTNFPLFREKLSQILEENGGEAKVLENLEDGEDNVEKALWDLAKVGWRPKGYKTNLNRFGATREKAMEMKPWWSISQMKYEHIALEMGMMKGKKLQSLLIKNPSLNPDGSVNDGSTDASRVCVSDRALRGCAQNSVVICNVVLGERWHYTLMCAIIEGSAPWVPFHKTQNRCLRSSEGAWDWLQAMLRGGFMLHVNDFFRVKRDRGALQRCGFDLRCATAHGDMMHVDFSNDLVAEKDDLANILGEFTLSFGSRRIARCLFLIRGWPLRMAGIGSFEKIVADETVSEFKLDYDAFKHLESQEGRDAAMEGVYKRSCFHDVAVQQYVQAESFGVPLLFCANINHPSHGETTYCANHAEKCLKVVLFACVWAINGIATRGVLGVGLCSQFGDCGSRQGELLGHLSNAAVGGSQ